MPGRKRQNPFRGVMDFMGEMSRMSDQMVGNENSSETAPRGHIDAWNPTTDVFARGDDVIMRVELPGVLPEDIEVNLSGGVLTVYGERPSDETSKDAYYVRERFWGHFRRSLTLPEGIDEGDISALFEEGLLRVTVKGASGAEGPAQIAVEHRRRS